MKILILSQHFYPENFRINDIAKELSKKNDISVVTGKPNYHTGYISPGYKKYKYNLNYLNNIAVHRVPIFPRGKKKNFLTFSLNYLSFIVSTIAYHKKFFKKDYDLAFIYATSPLLQALPLILLRKKLKCPIIIWVQDLWPESVIETGYIKNKLIIKLIRNLVSYIYKNVDYIFIQSKYFVNNIKSFNRDYLKKTWIYENPSEDFSKFKIRKKTINNKDKIITYSGNLGHAQDLDVFIELAKKFKKNNNKFVIHIYGEGTQKSYLKSGIIKNKLNDFIKIHNYLKPNLLYKELAKSDFLLITLRGSDAFSKTIPGKFQTYLYFGKPLLVVAKGYLIKKIKDYSLGEYTSPGSYNILYKKILNLSKNNKKIKMYSQNCKLLYINNYNIKNSVECLLNKFKELIYQN